jgi:hypothetical protein
LYQAKPGIKTASSCGMQAVRESVRCNTLNEVLQPPHARACHSSVDAYFARQLRRLHVCV